MRMMIPCWELLITEAWLICCKITHLFFCDNFMAYVHILGWS